MFNRYLPYSGVSSALNSGAHSARNIRSNSGSSVCGAPGLERGGR